MKILTVILSIYIFFKTLYYGIYEFKQNNRVSGISIMVLSLVCLIVPSVLVFLGL